MGVSFTAAPLPYQVVVRSKEFRKKTRDEGVREYFYGKKGLNSYFPFNFEVSFSEVKIFKIGGLQHVHTHTHTHTT